MPKNGITLDDLARLVTEGFDGVNKRLTVLEKRMDSIEERMTSIEKRVASIEERIGYLEKNQVKITSVLLEKQIIAN